ncbi:MAG: Flp family type IVb pilin [Pelotomaculum sp.]|nr:Flp family type IVb pilin [Pelotomaculum sp.]
MTGLIKRLLREENGQGMAEYGLILALIAVVVMAALAAIGGKINETFEDIKGKFEESQQQP